MRTAVGIDITETEVAAVLLKRTQKGVEVLQAARIPLPPGTITHGRTVDPASLLTVLKTLKRQHGMQAGHYALSLPVAGSLARVIPLETADPQEIMDYVQGEVRQYATFSGRETISDFRVLTPATQNNAGKVLVMASDCEAVTSLVDTCRSAGVQTSIVEMAVTACARGLDAAKQQAHTLLAVRKEGTLSLCVLHRGALDFIRTKPMATTETESSLRLAEEINAVIQFYNLERLDAPAHWMVTVLDDDGNAIPADARRDVEERVCAEGVQFWTGTSPMPHGVVYDGDHASLSFTALGLAMRLLEEEERRSGINLLPQEAGQARLRKRRALLAANVLAATVPAIVLVAGALSYMTGRVHHQINLAKQEELASGNHALATAVDELAYIEAQTAALEAELDCLRRASAARPQVDWCHLLADVKSAIPSVLRITELSLRGPTGVCIEGVSKSDEAVDVFLDTLNRSDHIGRASLLQKGRANSDQVGVRYTIRCSPPRGKK
ncbi:MAG: pilus assembly protein PilM [Phycisphaerales bacterium]|nr:MAG: pilus assembly protein PilM [Phycisphaerales bacterium]